MASVSFSLTQSFIVDPIQTLSYNPPARLADCDRDCDDLIYGIQAELITRVMAVFVSVFAIADASIHLMSGIYKACFTPECPEGEISWHFQKTLFFAAMAIIGPFAGFLFPTIFKDYWFAPEHAIYMGQELQGFILSVQQGKGNEVWPALKAWFERAKGEEKLLFFKTFEQEEKGYKTIRELFSRDFYKPVPGQVAHAGWLSPSELAGHLQKTGAWQSDPVLQKFQKELDGLMAGSSSETTETDLEALNARLRKEGFESIPATDSLEANTRQQRIDQIFEQAVCLNLGAYFHGTRTEKSLRSILTSKIEVRHEQAYRGAFVSNQPEWGYGPYYLALRKNIEFLSPPMNPNMDQGKGVVWSGFSQGIPVTEETLAYIAVRDQDQANCDALAIKCREWTGRHITVIPLDTIKPRIDSIRALGTAIPKDWPT